MNRLMALCLWGLAGCFSPLVVEGTHCSDKGECPPQLTCVEGVCRLPGTVADAAPPDASLPAIADARERVADAPPNGPPPADAPPNGPPWVGVTAGSNNGCALHRSGKVVCWGDNHLGQLGTGPASAIAAPGVVQGIDDAVEIVSGQQATCARRASGAVSCWGYSTVAGNDQFAASGTPKEVPGVTDAVSVAMTGKHACVRRSSGLTQCWGSNSHGEVGNGATSTAGTFTPSDVGLPAAAIDVHAGAIHRCAALPAPHGLACWGFNNQGQLGDG